MKKSNNKGFSLVELIVVVAIMAVLVGVLAPAYLRYVEKSRIQKDVSAITEVMHACEIAMADETVNKEVGTTGQTITLSGDTTLATTGTDKELEVEVAKSIAKVSLTSNGIKGATIRITASVNATTGIVSVTATYQNVTATDAVTALTNAGLTAYSAG